ncbi:Kelch_1 domain-containing protein/Kelch_6 domain-containing protein [Cephalotus follicularis]|uniref:Kelch_1 domain-containing protein/Kelch_6 domain-containing protein n=1 Tax=Cephalotus follicularis TaxID=3775 RepID=A0A1Q3DAC0_CEPFO|nr:Kelch_1 domain-containing protein/Kelch_6 domain-containing protein [Cephalotus follicularis]
MEIIIPDLPNDVARECLIRVSYNQFSTISAACKAWKDQIQLPQFLAQRKAARFAQKIIVMVQSRVDPNKKRGPKCFASPVYGLTLLHPDTGHCSELPTFSDHGLPLFCQLTTVGSELVVMGGLDPVTWEASNSIFVYNFVLARWRRGVDMPGVRRSFFGCASDLDRTVYVAGGHDDEKNALRSAVAYDVARDEWIRLPDMAKERDECKAVFHGGKFHVIGGYCTEMQGRFERSAEVFDVETRRWDPIQEDFLGATTCPRTIVGGDDVELYMCHGGDVLASRDTKWQAVAKLPAEVCNTAYVTTWQGKMLVIGSARFGEPHLAYVLDLKSYTWTKLDTTEKFSGHVQSGCYLEI